MTVAVCVFIPDLTGSVPRNMVIKLPQIETKGSRHQAAQSIGTALMVVGAAVEILAEQSLACTSSLGCGHFGLKQTVELCILPKAQVVLPRLHFPELRMAHFSLKEVQPLMVHRLQSRLEQTQATDSLQRSR